MTKKHFLVVGGTRGAGLALVKYLMVIEGNCVSVLGRSPGEEIASPNVMHYSVDVSNREALIMALDESSEKFGKISSAIFLQRHRANGDQLELELAVALSATKNAIEHLVIHDYFTSAPLPGSIVLVSSVADRYVAPEQSLGYHLSKAGLSQLGRYYAVKLGPKGIRVNTVSPCVVAKPEAKAFYDQNQKLVDNLNRSIPLGRSGKFEDIVNAIMFFAGEQASYITGQNLVVDGGLSLRTQESLIRDFSRGE
jgi:NAD(P)-dependent dehydrogenase (short-subunit alcohol dehydrogenase family)